MLQRNIVSRLHELNAYLEEFPPDAPGLETETHFQRWKQGCYLSFNAHHVEKQDY